MSVGLIVERPGNPIDVNEWRSLVACDPSLQMRDTPYSAVNPSNGAVIAIQVGEADSELLQDGEWLPFLRFKRGRLVTEYLDEFEDPANPIRAKIATVASSLKAVIANDADDELLDW
jgi:hypothetical protein